MNQSHWGGWHIETQAKTVYFAGDSGYFDEFKKIKQTLQAIDYALLPIGAYEPEWFMEIDHMQPGQAVEAFLDLQANTFIPMHYGTFRLADDTGPEALKKLHDYWRKKNIPEEQKKYSQLEVRCGFEALSRFCLASLPLFVTYKARMRKPHK